MILLKRDNLYTLIANDIIDYGKKNCNEFNYKLNLVEYLKRYNKQVQGYIRKNINSVISELKINSDILNIHYNQKTKELRFCFFPEAILNDLELKIYNILYDKVNISYKDVKVLSLRILQDTVINSEIEKIMWEVVNED